MTSSRAEKHQEAQPYLPKLSSYKYDPFLSNTLSTITTTMSLRALRTVLALQPRRRIHTTPALLGESQAPRHTTDSYNKDVDPSPPSDSKIHRVDPGSENVQKPHEAPSGEWSRAGTKTGEYSTVSKSQPYGAPGEDKRYGGKEMYPKEKGPETSKPEDGPTGKTSEGMKP
ncbi:hypothetical protein FPV67DRAFT_1473518, partial [Lyophyllum atratum]